MSNLNLKKAKVINHTKPSTF